MEKQGRTNDTGEVGRGRAFVAERRSAAEGNWRVREGVGVRPPRPVPRATYAEILERFEEQLKRLPTHDSDEAAEPIFQ